MTRALLRSGAAIAEMNTLRKHLSRIKGGRLAERAYPARLVTVAISDVPGDDPAVIGSGPTVPDPTTLADARAIIARYRLDVPEAVHRALADPGQRDAEARRCGVRRNVLRAGRTAGGGVSRRRDGGARRRATSASCSAPRSKARRVTSRDACAARPRACTRQAAAP